MARFWLVCNGKIPVKSDKLALIEGKTFNLMFLVIPVVPTENWLRLTHNQSRKTFKVTALFLRPHHGSNAAFACQIPGSDWAFYAKTFSWAQKNTIRDKHSNES